MLCKGEDVDSGHDFDAIWREAGPAIWRAVYAYVGGRREIADDAVAEAFARGINSALERIYSVTGGQVILSTETDMLGTRCPAMAFYPNEELNRDPTNWWGPNPSAVEAMLRTVGFRRVEIVYSYPLGLRFARAINWRLRRFAPFIRTLSQGRVVYHAWR